MIWPFYNPPLKILKMKVILLLTRMSHYRANAKSPNFLLCSGISALVIGRGLPRSGCGDTSTSIARITTLSRGISQGRGQALHFGMAAKMKGMTPTVDPASPAQRLEAHTSTRSSFARDELCEMCGLITNPIRTTDLS